MPKIHGNIIYKPIFELQNNALLNQALPVQNTYYTVLDTTNYIKLYGISILVADTGETLNARVTFDKQTLISSNIAANANTPYYMKRYQSETGEGCAWDGGLSYITQSLVLYEAYSAKVEVRKTSAAGNGNLKASVVYGVMKD